MNVTPSPYTNCGKCASCLRGPANTCQFNETLGVQRDGALLEKIWMHAEKLYPANLSIKELCIVEPLTVGFHAVGRGRVQPGDIVTIFGCGGVGLGAVAASHFAGALTEDFACVIQMLESGAFPVEQAVGTIVPLDQAPVILKQWSESPQRFTKIMVSLD